MKYKNCPMCGHSPKTIPFGTEDGEHWCWCSNPNCELGKNTIAIKGSKWNKRAPVDGETSDGYHTFNELYEFRKLYNALLFNEWAKLGKYDVHKSKRHYDGEECFEGNWFIVVADTPMGQITNHYKMDDWFLFNIPETEKAKIEYDGHTPQDVLFTMIKLIRMVEL